ncbi:MAG TPA: metallophosphoesterase [Myxococcales bacterium]|nr:metallophosphoesterase [Myxococcales bacterium]
MLASAALLGACERRACEAAPGADVVDPCGVEADGGTGAMPGTPDPGDVPRGFVGFDGGVVERLWFATTGDTRPARCNETEAYPKAAMGQIAAAMKELRVQFAVDLGDHMYVCADQGDLTDAQLDAAAREQMALYLRAIAQGPSTWWMTMGNHECGAAFLGGACAAGGAHDANFAAYMAALRRPSPYYATDVQTAQGLARFVIMADDAWSDAQAAWLSSALADADRRARYTFVVRHHPVQGPRTGRAEIVSILRRHRYSMILTAHDHDYHRDVATWQGRSVVVGLGGAGGRWGFGTVLQNPSGSLTFVRRDANGNPIGAPWTVAPQ